MNFKVSQRENQILSKLISKQLTSQEIIDNLANEYNHNLTARKKSFFKKFYHIDSKKALILVKDSNNTLKAEIKLSENKNVYKETDFRKWSDSTIVLNEENKKAGDFYFEDNQFTIGFLASDNTACLYNENIFKSKYIPKISSHISDLSPINKTQSALFDIFFSNDYSYMVVVDRITGNIDLIDINQDKIIKNTSIKANQNNKSINVAISSKKRVLYITDNSSTSVSIISFDDKENESINPAIGLLGSLILSPDETSLYILSTKPKPALKLYDLEKNVIKKDFPLKGDLFSLADAPYDLLSISDDKKFIYLMTYIPDPEPFTPVITIIETDKEKATQRFSIKDKIKISNLSIGLLNELEEKNILEILKEKNITDDETLKAIEKELDTEENDSNILKSLDINTDPTIMEIQPGRKTLSASNNEQKKEDIQWKINLVPQKIEYCNITPGLDSVLIKKISEKVLADYDASLRILADIEEWEKAETEINRRHKDLSNKIKDKNSSIAMRINDAITKARQELEWHDLAVIKLIELLDNYNFEISFTRVECLEWLREKERDELIETGLKTIATNCPNCNAQLLGSYSCRVCGFELEKPEEAVRRKLSQVSSYHPMENLLQGHLIITDTVNHKVIETDHFRRIVYELKKDVLHAELEVELEIPRDAVRLKNNITLVVDYGSNRVLKLTQRGKKYWELDYKANPDNVLNKPISVAALESGNIIIVDNGNHRVIEVNPDHEIEWSYGIKGESGTDNKLNSPTFFQRTKFATNIITDSGNNRILELEGNNIIWQYGNENNVEDDSSKGNGFNQLNMPLTAWRYENGNTLILDAGNNRIIEVNPDKEIEWEYNIEQNSEKIDKPVKAFRLKNGKIMLISENKIVEIDHSTKEITWSSSILELTGAASQTDINTTQDNVKKAKVFHGVANRYTKQVYVSDSKKEDEKMKSYVESKLTETGSKLIERSSVIVTPGAELAEIEFAYLDKVKSMAYLTDRKGRHIWKYGENGELKKPQSIFYNNSEIIITDTDNKRVIIFERKTFDLKYILKREDLVYMKSSVITDDNTILISDSLTGKIIEVNHNGDILNQIRDTILFKSPYYVSKLSNKNLLITDHANHQVIEIDVNKNIVWSYGDKTSGIEKGQLSYPEYAQRISNGDTLISDTRNNRVIQVNKTGEIIWSYQGQGIHKLINPTTTIRLENDHTIIYHSNNRQIIEIDRDGKILWKYLHQDRK